MSTRTFADAGDLAAFIDYGYKLEDILFPVIFTYLGYKVYIIEVVKHEENIRPVYIVTLMIEGHDVKTPVFYLVVNSTEEFIQKVIQEIEKLERTKAMFGSELFSRITAQIPTPQMQVVPTPPETPRPRSYRRYRRRTGASEFKPE